MPHCINSSSLVDEMLAGFWYFIEVHDLCDDFNSVLPSNPICCHRRGSSLFGVTQLVPCCPFSAKFLPEPSLWLLSIGAHRNWNFGEYTWENFIAISVDSNLCCCSLSADAHQPNDARSSAVTAMKLEVYRGPLKFWIYFCWSDVIHNGPQGHTRHHQI